MPVRFTKVFDLLVEISELSANKRNRKFSKKKKKKKVRLPWSNLKNTNEWSKMTWQRLAIDLT